MLQGLALLLGAIPTLAAGKACVFYASETVLEDTKCHDDESLVALALAKEEVEHRIVLLDGLPTELEADGESDDEQVVVSVVTTDFHDKSISLEWSQVGYVFTNKTTRVQDSKDGWFADPLLPPYFNKEKNATFVLWDRAASRMVLWLRFESRKTAKAGLGRTNFDILFSSTAGGKMATRRMTVTYKIWNFTNNQRFGLLPEKNSWDRLFTFGYTQAGEAETTHQVLSPPLLNSIARDKYFRTLSGYGIPPDNIYRHVPSIDDYQYLVEKTQQRLIQVLCATCMAETDGCNNFTDTYMANVEKKLDMIMSGLKEKNLFNKGKDFYVYGFDERPESCEPGIRKMFGMVKTKYPELKTLAVLNWKSIPADLPVDIVTSTYTQLSDDYVRNVTSVDGRQLLAYHCIEPSAPGFLNTFTDRQHIEARLMYWFGAGFREVSGWLYYEVALWRTGCPVNPVQHTPTERLSVDSARVDFNAGNCIWAGQYDFWANGDGQFLYPTKGDDAPLASVRLANFLDGFEDAYVLRSLDAEEAKEIVNQVVRSPKDFTPDANILETLRKSAGDRLEQKLMSGKERLEQEIQDMNSSETLLHI